MPNQRPDISSGQPARMTTRSTVSASQQPSNMGVHQGPRMSAYEDSQKPRLPVDCQGQGQRMPLVAHQGQGQRMATSAHQGHDQARMPTHHQGARMPTAHQGNGQRMPTVHEGQRLTVPTAQQGQGSQMPTHMQSIPNQPQTSRMNQAPAMHAHMPGQVSGPASRTRSRMSVSGMGDLNQGGQQQQQHQMRNSGANNNLQQPGQQQQQYFSLGEDNLKMQTKSCLVGRLKKVNYCYCTTGDAPLPPRLRPFPSAYLIYSMGWLIVYHCLIFIIPYAWSLHLLFAVFSLFCFYLNRECSFYACFGFCFSHFHCLLFFTALHF